MVSFKCAHCNQWLRIPGAEPGASVICIYCLGRANVPTGLIDPAATEAKTTTDSSHVVMTKPVAPDVTKRTDLGALYGAVFWLTVFAALGGGSFVAKKWHVSFLAGAAICAAPVVSLVPLAHLVESLRRTVRRLRFEQRQRVYETWLQSPQGELWRRDERERIRKQNEEAERRRKESEEAAARTKWRQFHESATMDQISRMTGRDFEEFLARLLRRMGYTRISLTPTNDQGADLICISSQGVRIAVQAKRWIGSVGNSAIQEIYAAIKFYDCDAGMVITNSTFTDAARALAKKTRIALYDGRWLKEQIKNHLPPTIPEFNWDEFNKVVMHYTPRESRRRAYDRSGMQSTFPGSVSQSQPDPTASTAKKSADVSSKNESVWFIQVREGGGGGPFSADQIREMISKSGIGPDDLIRNESSEWNPAKTFPSISQFFSSRENAGQLLKADACNAHSASPSKSLKRQEYLVMSAVLGFLLLLVVALVGLGVKNWGSQYMISPQSRTTSDSLEQLIQKQMAQSAPTKDTKPDRLQPKQSSTKSDSRSGFFTPKTIHDDQSTQEGSGAVTPTPNGVEQRRLEKERVGDDPNAARLSKLKKFVDAHPKIEFENQIHVVGYQSEWDWAVEPIRRNSSLTRRERDRVLNCLYSAVRQEPYLSDPSFRHAIEDLEAWEFP